MTKVAAMRALTVVPSFSVVPGEYSHHTSHRLKLAWLLKQNAAKAFENALYNVLGLVL
jgi:hypothetical protein